MKCAYCGRSVWKWQSSRPLGGGLLLDDFGQREHAACQRKRFSGMTLGEIHIGVNSLNARTEKTLKS